MYASWWPIYCKLVLSYDRRPINRQRSLMRLCIRSNVVFTTITFSRYSIAFIGMSLAMVARDRGDRSLWTCALFAYGLLLFVGGIFLFGEITTRALLDDVSGAATELSSECYNRFWNVQYFSWLFILHTITFTKCFWDIVPTCSLRIPSTLYLCSWDAVCITSFAFIYALKLFISYFNWHLCFI